MGPRPEPRLFGKTLSCKEEGHLNSRKKRKESNGLLPGNRMLSSRARVAVAALLFGVGLALFVATTVLSLAHHCGLLSCAQRSFLVGTI